MIFEETLLKSSVSNEASGSAPATTSGRGKGRRRSSAASGRSTSIREHTPSDNLSTTSENYQGLNPTPRETSATAVEPLRVPLVNAPLDDLASPSTVRAQSPPASLITSPWSDESDDDNGDEDEDEDDSLPEFWEEMHLPDGKRIFLDHRTQSTSWKRPRKNARFKLADPEESWTARLQAPLPDVPETDNYSTRAREGPWSDVAPSILSHESVNTDVVADLLRDGYVLGDTSTDDGSQPDAVPDFWEVRRGTDGHTYYIDHPAGIILRGR